MTQSLEEKTKEEESKDRESKFGLGIVVKTLLVPGYQYKFLYDEGKKSGRNLFTFSTVLTMFPLEIIKAGVYTYSFFVLSDYLLK